MLTALAPAYQASQSPFQALRSELKHSASEDVYFVGQQSAAVAAAISNTPYHLAAGRNVTRLENVADATIFDGPYPPVDPTQIGLLWFAFTPPLPQQGETGGLLRQVWDDGNRTVFRFRQATWQQFSQPPHLLSNAVYRWLGREFLPDGSVREIRTSDVRDPQEIAAKYDVDSTTNYAGLVLPLHFNLTRYAAVLTQGADNRVLSTVSATVTGIRRLESGRSLTIELPGKTYVEDFRASAGGLAGSPVHYLVGTNSLPTVEEVRQGSLNRGALRTAEGSSRSNYEKQ
jgi:hypothetical protein